ncbi:MAG: hypothetical protein V2J65_11865 [Desulfobacteraceae bacterium]|jgi:hypothetical protein|nr:hypothetical protein [Desulfobacteraceae bacterium]
MPIANMLSITSNPFLSMMVWIVLLLAALYFARKPFHRVVGSLAKIIHNAMRLTATSILSAESNLVRRNREVLIAAGLEKAERLLEREFDRINSAVIRDLASYPHLQRQLLEFTTRLNEDYSASADVPPSLPNWRPIIESIAGIKHTGDSMVANMLGEINRTLKEQHKSAIENYRKSHVSRYGILKKMLPVWRKVQKTLNKAGNSIDNLNRRAKSIDRYMDDYEQIRLQTDKAARLLSSSSLTQFFSSGLFLLIAGGAVFINYNMIALPMSEMIGNVSDIGPYKTSDVAVLVIILIELTMGLFIMESLRITRIFPNIGSMDDIMRRRIMWIAFSLLAILAGLGSALAVAGDRFAWHLGAFGQSIADTEQTASVGMLPAVGQMIMGFIFPFALVFAAIPLESFISSCRTVLGIIAVGALRLIAFGFRLVGNIGYYAGRFVINLYDLLIFPTIWLEGVLASPKTNKNVGDEHQLYGGRRIIEEMIDRE